MLYTEIKNECQNKFNKIKIFFVIAFNDDDAEKQFREGLKKYNLTEDEVVYIGGGGYTTEQGFEEMKRISEEKMSRIQHEVIPNKSEFVNALHYEINNFEYVYSHDDDEILSCFGFSSDDLKTNEYLNECFVEAVNEYMSKINM